MAMTFADATNPNKWGEGVRWLIGGLLFVIFTGAATGGGALYAIGQAKQQLVDDLSWLHHEITSLRTDIKDVKEEQQNVRAGLVTEHEHERDLDTNVRVLTQKVDDVDLKVDSVQAITKSHDADIKATRDAVAPRAPNAH